MNKRMSEEQMAGRVARELKDGFCVNLGIGMPMMVASYMPPGVHILIHSENGVLGVGPHAPKGMEDKDLGNAGDENVMVVPGASFFDSAEAFAMVRGGHLDVTVLGGFQVSEKGDLSNWKVLGRAVGSYGGAMDLASGAKKVIVMMKHTTPQEEPKIVTDCTYPITARRCVSMIVTDVAVIDITKKGLCLREMAPGWTTKEVQAITGPRLNADAAVEWVE
jgi:3-oxoacid CoA-transferase subunit B